MVGWRVCWASSLALAGLTVSLAQPIEGGVRQGFSAADTDRATGRRKWLLQGDGVNPVSKGVYEITQVRLWVFGVDGRTNLLAVTDRCLFNNQTTNLSAAGKLRLDAAEGQFSIEGVGYELQLGREQLALSNDVHAVLDKRILAAARTNEGPRTPSPGRFSLLDTLRPTAGAARSDDRVQVYSRQFNSETNLAVFRGDVRVEDEQGKMTCQSLAVQFNLGEQRLETILAKDAVTLESGEIRATATEAVFDPGEEAIHLRGNLKWSLGERSGEAEAAVVELRTGRLHAWGNARLELPPGAVVGVGSWLPSASAKTPPVGGERDSVRVEADDFDYAPDPVRTNVAVAVCRGQVRVSDRRGQLTCGVLTAESRRPGNEPLTAVAEEGVTVEQGSGRVTCERSAYDASTGVIEMTGHPAWRFGDKEGHSDLLRLDVSNKVYQAKGNVKMQAAAESLGRSPWLLPRAHLAKQTAPGGAPSDAPARLPLEVTCDEFEFRSAAVPGEFDQAVYRHRVRVSQGEQMNLVCDRITATLIAGTNQAERVVADGAVELRSRAARGESRARGDQAVYTAAQNQVELTGAQGVEVEMTDGTGRSTARGRRAVYDGGRDLLEMDGTPVLAMPQGSLTGTVVRVDRSNSTFTASGQWRLRLPAKALANRAPGASP